jgi:predicted TIM-barrel fold metal-dependent hydrolase
VRCALETVGADHVLFGTDAPPLTTLKPRGLQLIRDLDIPDCDKEKILSENARRLLKLQ